jgi:hypothetical protein
MNWGAAGLTVLGLFALETLDNANAGVVKNIGGLVGGPAKLANWILDPTIPAFSAASTDALLDPAGNPGPTVGQSTPTGATPANGNSPTQTILGLKPNVVATPAPTMIPAPPNPIPLGPGAVVT